MRLKTQQIPITVILLIALSLRLSGIGFGLPLISNFYIRPDETLISVPAIRMLESWGNPHFFSYPALMMEISAVFYQIYFVLLKMLGATSASSISMDFGSDMSGYVIISRSLSALFSTATVMVIYRLACKVIDRQGALLAAALLTAAPLACRDAHFGVTDSLVTLCAAASVYTLAGYLETGRRGQLCVASMLFGLAFSAKYSAATIFPLLFLAVLFNGNTHGRTEKIKQLAISATVPIPVFLLFNPYIIPEFGKFIGSVDSIIGTLYFNHQPGLPIGAVLKQALTPLKYGPAGMLCLPLMLASMLFVSRNALTSRIRWLITAAFILALLPVISFKHPMPFRYVLPALPCAAILVTLGIRGFAERFDPLMMKIVYAGFILTALAPTLISSAWTDILLSRKDSRTLAGEWISGNVGRKIPVVLAGWPECEPQLPETERSILRRIDFVRRFYGESAVPVVARPYHLQLDSGIGEKRPGYELYRTAVPTEIPGNRICLVVPTYPNSICALRSADIPSIIARYPGRITAETEIKSLRHESAGHVLDPIDAFFLPMDKLGNIVRPGPGFRIYLISRNSRKAE
jgi:4-amino-4-deoxy-L-arabinose transferase-like glycosyltransferase